jgi:hypothetical protein
MTLTTFAGVVTLLSNHIVCHAGKPLTPEQARVLVRKPGPWLLRFSAAHRPL